RRRADDYATLLLALHSSCTAVVRRCPLCGTSLQCCCLQCICRCHGRPFGPILSSSAKAKYESLILRGLRAAIEKVDTDSRECGVRTRLAPGSCETCRTKCAILSSFGTRNGSAPRSEGRFV